MKLPYCYKLKSCLRLVCLGNTNKSFQKEALASASSYFF